MINKFLFDQIFGFGQMCLYHIVASLSFRITILQFCSKHQYISFQWVTILVTNPISVNPHTAVAPVISDTAGAFVPTPIAELVPKVAVKLSRRLNATTD
jgi:hypothetical protein